MEHTYPVYLSRYLACTIRLEVKGWFWKDFGMEDNYSVDDVLVMEPVAISIEGFNSM